MYSLLKIALVSALITYNVQCFAQTKSVLFYKDGTSQTGYVTFKKKEIKFQEQKDGKKEKIEYEKLDSISGYINPRSKRKDIKPRMAYVFPTGKNDKNFQVFDLVKKGKVNLYKLSKYGNYSVIWVPSNNSSFATTPIPVGTRKTITIYGVKRDNETFVTILGNKDTSVSFVTIADSFKTQGSDYFSDCTELATKIKDGEKGFRKEDIKKVVDYYNTDCSEVKH
ncbi:hypothetical protein [Xanthomarina spongicola]|uniref:GLPGLI family protein n=1 Tax=Xanthomarina spongicola TaxID=570520 RepID=A0A316DN24_9FLAO|nr:hypothetical protein [Xanthomarina spongicola]PWK19577.1 hypothetical protein LX78_00925 [Xanthomarina spongicola]